MTLRRFVAVCLALLTFLAVVAPALADEPPPDSACKRCHTGATGEVTLRSIRRSSPEGSAENA